MKIRGKSKKFNSLYQLQYHLNIHDVTDENVARITKDHVREIVKQVSFALEMEMFLQ